MSSKEPQIEAMLTPQTPVIAERGLKKSSCNYVSPLEEQKSEGRIVPEGTDTKVLAKSAAKKLPALKTKSKRRKTSKKKKQKQARRLRRKARAPFSCFFGVHPDI